MVSVPVSQYLMRKSSNIENAPPTRLQHQSHTKARLTANNITRDATRRRRQRTTSGAHTRHLVEQAIKKRSTKTPVRVEMSLPTPPVSPRDVEMTLNTPPPAPQPSTRRLQLPRSLSRPAMRPVSKQAILACDPEYKNTPLYIVRAGLQMQGPDLLKVAAHISADTSAYKNELPKEVTAVVNDISSDMPTHMFAVWSERMPAGAQRRQVTLYPSHSLVFAAHCSAMPPLTFPKVEAPKTVGSQITLPIVPLRLPDSGSFPYLSTYLYTHRADQLFHTLIPVTAPNVSPCISTKEMVTQYAYKLAAVCPTPALLRRADFIIGIWGNACAMGISDTALWGVIDISWQIVLAALDISTKRDAGAAGAQA